MSDKARHAAVTRHDVQRHLGIAFFLARIIPDPKVMPPNSENWEKVNQVVIMGDPTVLN